MDWSKVTATINETGEDEVSLRQHAKLIKADQRYTSKKFLNEGAMKRIYKCKDLSTSREVAYTIPKSSAANVMESFLREAHITAALQHPNIVPVYDIGIKHETPYFVMKLIQGQSLADIIFKRNKRYSLKSLLDIFTKVCEAISYTHSKGIIHLDLKPDNIQISEHGEVTICDWGLAKVIDWEGDEDEDFLNDEAFYKADALQNTLYGYVKGTPGYMSPEQAKGAKANKSYASDIYSLGTILYTILTKKPPIKSNDLEVVLNKTIKGDFKHPRSINKNIPTALEAICLKAMAKREVDRYRSVQELLDDLDLYFTGFAPKAEEVGLIKQGRLLISRRPLLFASITTSITVIALISLSASYLLQIKNETLAVQKEEIESQKDEIEEHLETVKQSKNKLEQASLLASKEALEKAVDKFNEYRLDEATKLNNTALSLNPNNADAQGLKLALAFVNLDLEGFEKQIEVLNLQEGKRPKVFHILKKLAHFKLNPKTPPHKALSLAQLLPSGGNLSRLALYKYLELSPHSPEKMAIIPKLLAIHNGGVIPKNFSWKYQNGFYEIDLSNNPHLDRIDLLSGLAISRLTLKNLTTPALGKFSCPTIKYLDLSKSQLSGSDVTDFNQLNFPKLETLILDNYKSRVTGFNSLKNTKIKKLSLRKTNLIDYRFLASMDNLEEVILDNMPNKFPRRVKNKVTLEP